MAQQECLKLLARLQPHAHRILARSHARARRSNGAIAAAAIAEAVADGTSLVETITAFVLDYGPIVLDDHARLVELLAMHGPTLGYR